MNYNIITGQGKGEGEEGEQEGEGKEEQEEEEEQRRKNEYLSNGNAENELHQRKESIHDLVERKVLAHLLCPTAKCQKHITTK